MLIVSPISVKVNAAIDTSLNHLKCRLIYLKTCSCRNTIFVCSEEGINYHCYLERLLNVPSSVNKGCTTVHKTFLGNVDNYLVVLLFLQFFINDIFQFLIKHETCILLLQTWFMKTKTVAITGYTASNKC